MHDAGVELFTRFVKVMELFSDSVPAWRRSLKNTTAWFVRSTRGSGRKARSCSECPATAKSFRLDLLQRRQLFAERRGAAANVRQRQRAGVAGADRDGSARVRQVAPDDAGRDARG